MGKFTQFVKQKLEESESKKVSSNLLKNIIDVIKEYIVTEFDLSEDEKMQIINNMEIGVETHEQGFLKNSPKFVAISKYNESEGESVPVEIVIDIVTEKLGGSSEVEPVEEPDIPDEEIEEPTEEGGEE
ncbi:MAG: hypothetical protein ACOC5T_10070 [Elusimicrobiota bacterium]